MNAVLDFGTPPVRGLQATRDGRLVQLRPIRASDGALLEAFFSALSPATRHRRFHGGVNNVTPALLQRMTQPDPRHEMALLAIAVDAGRTRCVGEARYAAGDGPPGEREFALVVADAWQGAGLGSTMLRRLDRHARDQGVERLVGDVLADNAPMIALARRHGYAVQRHPTDARLLRMSRALEPARPVAAACPAWCCIDGMQLGCA